jgi:hypothetical protein
MKTVVAETIAGETLKPYERGATLEVRVLGLRSFESAGSPPT